MSRPANRGPGMLPTPAGPPGGLMGDATTANLLNSITRLTRTGSRDSKLAALNIINAVLASDEGQETTGYGYGQPSSKRSRMDMGGGYDDWWGQGLTSSRPSLLGQGMPQRDQSSSQVGSTWSPHRSNTSISISQGPRRQFKPARTSNWKSKSTKSDRDKIDIKSKEKEEEKESSDDESEHESESRREEEKEKEKDKDKELKEESDEEEDCPSEALKCHICDAKSFDSKTEYTSHLDSKGHTEMVQIYHGKKALQLQLLRADAKVSAMKLMVKLRQAGTKKEMISCTKCQCHVFGSLNWKLHTQSLEHRLVQEFLHTNCCGKSFKTLIDMEKHRLSLKHLKVTYLEEENQNDVIDENTPPDVEMSDDESEEEDDPLRKVMKELQCRVKGNLGSLSQLQPYDPSHAIGMTFINYKEVYRCNVCNYKFWPNMTLLDHHCYSNKHYTQVLENLKEQDEEKKKKEKEREKEKEKEKEVEQSKKEAEKVKNEDNKNKEVKTKESKGKGSASKTDEVDDSEDEDESTLDKEKMDSEEEEEEDKESSEMVQKEDNPEKQHVNENDGDRSQSSDEEEQHQSEDNDVEYGDKDDGNDIVEEPEEDDDDDDDEQEEEVAASKSRCQDRKRRRY